MTKTLSPQEARGLTSRAESVLFALEMEYAQIAGSAPPQLACQGATMRTLAECNERMEQLATRARFLRSEIAKHKSLGTEQKRIDNILKNAKEIGVIADGAEA